MHKICLEKSLNKTFRNGGLFHGDLFYDRIPNKITRTKKNQSKLKLCDRFAYLKLAITTCGVVKIKEVIDENSRLKHVKVVKESIIC